ncbi:MAG: transglutaminase domain-containing protein [Spirochaetales bacterium]|nr:transglutaminase domain-containing protein [Spirochaetales bacterium]
MRKHLPLFIVVVVLLSLVSAGCVTRAALHSTALFLEDEKTLTVGRTYAKVLNYTYEIPDFEPLVMKVEKLDIKPTESAETEAYYSKMNDAVSLMRSEKFKQAIDALMPMIGVYRDKGIGLYNLGICYLNLKEYDKGRLYLANSYAAGCRDAFRAIDNLNSVIAFDYFQQKKWADAIRYYKTAPADENVSMNVIYCYMELAKTLPRPTNLIMLLYAGNYIVDNGVLDKNILALGDEIGKQLGDSPVEAFLPDAIDVLTYLVKETGNPWTHINLGMLYVHSGKPELAHGQFRLAVERAGGNRDLYRFASGRLVEMGPAAYAYRKEIPFTVTLKSGDLTSAEMEGVFSIPQNGFGETVSSLEVALNGKPVAFDLVKDRYHAEFVSLKLSGDLKAGDNTLTISAQVARKPRRTDAEELAALTAASYDQRSPQYKLYTESSKIYKLSHPLVKKAVADIRKTLKNKDVASIVRAVYDYVIDKMSYELYDNENRPKKDILDRLQKTGGVGLCEDYAVFTASVLRAFGIPALVMAGPTYNAEIGHAWPAVFTPQYDRPIVVDTTWGDSGEMPNYYFLFNTNQTVVEEVGWDSDVLPDAMSSSYRHTNNIAVEFKKEKSEIAL